AFTRTAMPIAAIVITTSTTAAAQSAIPTEVAAAPQATQMPPPVPQPPAPRPAPSRPPVFNRANELMPSWLRVRGEFRERFEGFEGSNFIEGRDDAYALTRVRFNVAVTASK